MQLKDILDDLMYGELSNHAMCMNGSINLNDRIKLIAHINMGLNEIYTRFPLLTKEVVIKQIAGVTQYFLKKEHAITDPTNTVKYIIDSNFYPFTEDVLRIESVFDECGDRYLANSNSSCKVYATPSYDCIELPYPIDTNALSIIYRAKHPKVSLDTDTINLMPSYKPVLLSYVAHRVYSGGTAQEHVNKSLEFIQKFELHCMQLEKEGMTNSFNELLNNKLEIRGWI